MTAPPVSDAERLRSIRQVIAGPLFEIAHRLSDFLQPRWPHTALVIFTRECTGRPRKVAGDAQIVSAVTIDELEVIKDDARPAAGYSGTKHLGGQARWIWAARDTTDTLLVLVPQTPGTPAPHDEELSAVFGLVATSISQQVVQASPDYLAESRAASVERARTIAELTAAHEASLASILSALRSRSLDDAQARLTAREAATAALLALRSTQTHDRALSEETPAAAFKRLRREIATLLRDQTINIDYIAPPAGGRPIPGEVAYAARAMTATCTLAFTAQADLSRIRIGWQCDGTNLIVDIRDQGPGGLDSDTLRHQLDARARALGATLTIEVLDGWGSRVIITYPLEPPATRANEELLADLNAREREVLAHLSSGKRNKAIADELGVSESTVKFHVGKILRKLGVATRGEAVAIGLQPEQGRAVPEVTATR
ncbi:helix-turn-helix transcriptional regulator [Hoyosella subflava]|uniref:Putative transcriptional regulator, LuxR family n=1 Tax=Hoyosella subflava (strain DSM 45089 / JCM 17490 / NBRC 109087 / DQS3-9A1) TaxID=443218 RepID=F6ERW7_HOYSD|nr:LuxR C-terminal-related transcriptional regulator [Hoyosella subflava]AEF40782.1 putative transcriptional regulator, LuxR family [Hoyosella subflava DQS3-9A1]